MPAANPPIPANQAAQLAAWGERLRDRRKALRISATAAAEAAGMSRVTWHRIENGEASVTMGAWLAAMAAIGLRWDLEPSGPSTHGAGEAEAEAIPVRVHLPDFPELRRLAWQVKGTDDLSPLEALDIYERNARHLDEQAMTPRERGLLKALRTALGARRRDA